MAGQKRLRTSNPRAQSTVALVQHFIEEECDRDIYFLRTTGGLKVLPCARRRGAQSKNGSISDVVITKLGHETKTLRIRNNPDIKLNELKGGGPFTRLEVGAGPRWLPLSTWLHRHYDDFSFEIENDENFLCYRLLKQYIRQRDFPVWVKTRYLKIRQVLLDDPISWRCTICSTMEPNFEVEARLQRNHVQPSVAPDLTDIEVKSQENWQPFLEWVGSSLEMSATSDEILSAQVIWWDENGLTFRLMDLPLELREAIYAQITGPYLWPHLMAMPAEYWREDRSSAAQWLSKPLKMFDPSKDNLKDYVWRKIVSSSQFHLDPAGDRPPPPTAIIHANSQIKFEFWQRAWRSTTMHFQDYFSLCFAIHDTRIGQHLRSISLGFPNLWLFEFVGFATWYHVPFAPVNRIPVKDLNKLETLKNLDFHFQIAPPDLSKPVILDPFRFRLRDDHTGELSCQKILVDWFLTLALSHIRHIPNISISGHIKNSTRVKWGAIFADERQGIKHDMSAQIQSILSTHWQQIPLLCACEHPCDWWEQHGPYPEGARDLNFDPMPYPSQIEYDPRKHDRFNYEG